MSIELIAEVASNHGGDLEVAKEFIHRFADAGADWIKFQTTRVKHLRPADPQYAWFEQAELSDEAHHWLKAECDHAGVKMLTTVYHADDVPFVASLGLDAVKIGSGEACEARVAEAVMARAWPRAFVSLGLCGNNPYQSAFGRKTWVSRLTFLGAVTRYPAPVGVAAKICSGPLRGWSPPGPLMGITGWSDHAEGLSECYSAVVSGATVIEKHVQLPNQKRPPQSWEATVAEFRALRAYADEDPSRFVGRWQYA